MPVPERTCQHRRGYGALQDELNHGHLDVDGPAALRDGRAAVGTGHKRTAGARGGREPWTISSHRSAAGAVFGVTASGLPLTWSSWSAVRSATCLASSRILDLDPERPQRPDQAQHPRLVTRHATGPQAVCPGQTTYASTFTLEQLRNQARASSSVTKTPAAGPPCGGRGVHASATPAAVISSMARCPSPGSSSTGRTPSATSSVSNPNPTASSAVCLTQ
jgi:hypothetical protein